MHFPSGCWWLQTAAAAQAAVSASTSIPEEEDQGMDADELKVLCNF